MAKILSGVLGTSQSDLQRIAGEAGKWTVRIRAGRHGIGSGIVWQDGVVVTNAHVALRDRLEVEASDGRVFSAEVRERHLPRDLAVVRVPADQLPPAEIGDSTELRPGELVMAMGNPVALSNALALGVVHRAACSSREGSTHLIQIDLRLAPGYSGGPLLNSRGQVVGVNSMVAGGLGIAVAATEVHAFIAEAVRPKLGVRVRPVTLDVEGERSNGLLVLEVQPQSAAAMSGLLVGDVLLTANGTPLNPASAQQALRVNRSSGLTLTLIRGGRSTVVSVPFPNVTGESSRAA